MAARTKAGGELTRKRRAENQDPGGSSRMQSGRQLNRDEWRGRRDSNPAASAVTAPDFARN